MYYKNIFSWAKTPSTLAASEPERTLKKEVFQPHGYGICSSSQRTPGEGGELNHCSLFIIQLNTGATLLSLGQVQAYTKAELYVHRVLMDMTPRQAHSCRQV